MRSRFILLTLSSYLFLISLGCTGKTTSTDNATSATATDAQNPPATNAMESSKEHGEHEAKKEPLVVPSGASIAVSLGSALGSKLSQTGQTFTGSVAKDVKVGETVAIRKGDTVNGTVTDAKALGKFAGGATLVIRLDSINIKGADLPVQAATRTFSAKGKGKRTAVMTGGGAALGGIIGALAGGGKGAAIGMAAGGGAGAGGAALTGNKDIVLPAESDIAFELSQPLEIKR
jgi:hypothetical protein